MTNHTLLSRGHQWVCKMHRQGLRVVPQPESKKQDLCQEPRKQGWKLLRSLESFCLRS